jgi:hypothetical protein
MTAKIFISYAREDKSAAEKLAEELSKDPDLKIFYDRDTIFHGEDWGDKIAEEITNSDAILLLISPRFLSSAYCSYESGFALKQNQIANTPLVPIYIRTVDQNSLPPFLKDRTGIDARKISSRKLLDMIKSTIAQHKK